MKIAAPIAINFIEALSINYQNKSLNRHVLYQVKNVKSNFFPFFLFLSSSISLFTHNTYTYIYLSNKWIEMKTVPDNSLHGQY